MYYIFPGFTTCCTHASIIYTVFQVLPTSFPCFTNLYYSFLVLLPPVYILFQVLPTHNIHLSFTVFSPPVLKFSRLYTGSLDRCDHDILLKKFNWLNMKCRRIKHGLTMIYKIERNFFSCFTHTCI